MNNLVFEHNMQQLSCRDSALASCVALSSSDSTYAKLQSSKTGQMIPLSADGIAYNSLYDPLKEARLLIDSVPSGTFVFFAGIAGAFHIREFLNRYPESSCIIAESSFASFRSLLELIDLSDLIGNSRVSIFPDCTDSKLVERFAQIYLPSIHGDFRLLSLRSWQLRNHLQNSVLEQSLQLSLTCISSDYSVQSHFGRLWLRNFIQNVQEASSFQGAIPRFDLRKTAVIIAAGPGLENALDELRTNREKYIVLTTDTAFSVLVDSGIIPDVFVSIDAQHISLNHVMHSLPSEMTVVLDLCGNSAIARRAIACGCNILFVSGSHPLSRYATRFGYLPLLDTRSGTVTIATLDVAHSLGFTDIRLIGADFAYVNGKPYARGTYLSAGFGNEAFRLQSEEQLFSALMFRTPVGRTLSGSHITYTSETLDRYALSYKNYRSENLWKNEHVTLFPAQEFLVSYQKSLENVFHKMDLNDPVLYTILPFIAWHSRTFRESQKGVKNAIQLALDLIAGYTEVS